MVCVIFPANAYDYADFAIFSAWMERCLRENLVDSGEIYDLDHFHIFEEEYIFSVLHFFQPKNFKENFCQIFEKRPNKADFEYIKKSLIFGIDEQVARNDQEENVVMGFSPDGEKCRIAALKWESFLKNYDGFLEKISTVVQKPKNEDF